MKRYLANHHFTKGDCGTIQANRSIWWNLKHKGKPLDLIQGCSAKGWAHKGVQCFNDILKDAKLKDWNDLNSEFNIPLTNWRTYTILKEACNQIKLPIVIKNDTAQFKDFQWKNGNNIMKSKVKEMYTMLIDHTDLTEYLNQNWKL